MSGCDDVDIDHVGRAGSAGEFAEFVRLVVAEGHDVAAPQEASQLHLSRGPAHLGDNWSSRERHKAEIQAGPMIGPPRAVGAVRCDQGAGVIDDAHAERFFARADVALTCETTRWRAAVASASVSAPWSASHSATAASPSRASSAWRAAFVIQAETLTPSAAAAARTRSCTSASTVIANFGDGFPLGVTSPYYSGSRVNNQACTPLRGDPNDGVVDGSRRDAASGGRGHHRWLVILPHSVLPAPNALLGVRAGCRTGRRLDGSPLTPLGHGGGARTPGGRSQARAVTEREDPKRGSDPSHSAWSRFRSGVGRSVQRG